MELDRIGSAARPPFAGAFHDYVLSVSLEQAARSRLLASRARRLRRFWQRPTSGAVQRWEGEGGSTG